MTTKLRVSTHLLEEFLFDNEQVKIESVTQDGMGFLNGWFYIGISGPDVPQVDEVDLIITTTCNTYKFVPLKPSLELVKTNGASD